MCCVAFMTRAAVRGGAMAWPWARSAFVLYIQLYFVFYTIFASLGCYLGVGSYLHVRTSSERRRPGSVSAETEAVFDSSRDLTETPRFSTRPRSIEASGLQQLTLLRFKNCCTVSNAWFNTVITVHTPPACSPHAEWGDQPHEVMYPRPRTGLQFPSRNVHAWHGCKWDAIIIRYPNPVLGSVHPTCCCLS